MKQDIKIGISLITAMAAFGCGGGEERPDAVDTPEPAAAAPSPAAADMGDVDAALAQRGGDLFAAKGCIGCHRVGGGRLVGPDLSGVAERRSRAWILAMITNPDSMLQNDDTARELLGEYMTPMPSQNITRDEALALLEYVRSESQ